MIQVGAGVVHLHRDKRFLMKTLLVFAQCKNALCSVVIWHPSFVCVRVSLTCSVLCPAGITASTAAAQAGGAVCEAIGGQAGHQSSGQGTV